MNLGDNSQSPLEANVTLLSLSGHRATPNVVVGSTTGSSIRPVGGADCQNMAWGA